MLNVVSDPLVMSICFPRNMTSISFVGLLSRSIILAASLAACVPLFIASPTSAFARAGASLVPSPTMATILCLSFSFITTLYLSMGFEFAMYSSIPAIPEMYCAVTSSSPVHIIVLISIAFISAILSFIPGFITSSRAITPTNFPSFTTGMAVPPFIDISLHRASMN